MKGLITMKKLIPLFLAAILLLCNIFAGNALAANETAPEALSIPTGVASATPHETDLFFLMKALIRRPPVCSHGTT